MTWTTEKIERAHEVIIRLMKDGVTRGSVKLHIEERLDVEAWEINAPTFVNDVIRNAKQRDK